jgi:uncharacterized membrane protein/glycosyltransferase involved in cell wall biosynthesis
MKNKKQLFMSVVVIAYNAEKTIGRTLQSLLAQKYPADKYEIIVVDDGSTDHTGAVVLKHKTVRYIRLPENQGISAARNAGIAAVRGDIYVSFDDDCVADPKWLQVLAKGYSRTDAAGVGGAMTTSSSLKGLVRKYIHATGEGRPPVAGDSTKVPFIKRITRYATACFKRPAKNLERVAKVEELYGANGSYPIEVIRSVDGWDRDFSGVEDRELSKRIRAKYPDKHFYSMRDAKIMHDPGLTLRQYLNRPYRRGPVNLKFHLKYRMLPPIMPFPVLMAGLTALIAVLQPLALPMILLLLPQLLYGRWQTEFFRTGRPYVLLFPYLQLMEESMVVLGLLKGAIALFRSKYMSAWKWVRPEFIGSLLVLAGWAYVELGMRAGIPRTLLTILFLLSVPGYMVVRSLIGYGAKLPASRLIGYAVGVSVVTLMLVGLGTNTVLGLAGVQHPLALRPLTAAIGVVTFAATLAANLRKPADYVSAKLPWRTIRANWAYIAAAVALPFIAAGGAITLNNGGSDKLALLGLGGVGLYFLALLWRRKPTAHIYPLALYSVSLSILLGTSLRGWHITGHDVMQEYQVFELTLQHAAWHMSYYQDAYNACLSITILPTIFRQMTGMNDPFVFKFIFQLFFALIAPVMYNTLRNFTSKRIALLSVFVFVTFPAFLTDITMLTRQETALLCFLLALQAGLDRRLGKKGKLLAFVFLLGMVLSHYSTSYVATTVLLITSVLSGGVWLVRRLFKRAKPVRSFTIFPFSMVLATLVLLVTWGSLVTQTSGHIAETLEGVVTGLPDILNGTANEDNSSRTGQVVSNNGQVQAYFQNWNSTRTLANSEYYADGAQAGAALTAKTDTISPVAAPLASHVSSGPLVAFYDFIKQFYGLLIEGLVGLGVVLVLLVKRWRRVFAGQYMLLIIASLMVIGMQVVLPASLVNYGLLRIIQQGLLVLALPLVLACLWLMGLVRIPKAWRAPILGSVLVFLFLVLSGVLPAITGGYKPSLPLSNSGFYYEAYYTHASEISADKWLAQKTPKGSRVYSDEFTRRKMIAYTGIFSQPTLSPGSIPIDSYVYLGVSDTQLQTIPAYHNGALIYYTAPTAFLQSHKNLVYSSGDVQIYK